MFYQMAVGKFTALLGLLGLLTVACTFGVEVPTATSEPLANSASIPIPTVQATVVPTPIPTVGPTAVPTPLPTVGPTAVPTPLPTATPKPTPKGPPEILVTSLDDTFDGVCDGHCSLREAISEANAGDVIVLPSGVFTLANGELFIRQDQKIIGDPMGRTVIQAASEPGVATHRLFSIAGGDVELAYLTLRHGQAAGGGAILIQEGNLTIADSLLTANISNHTSGGGAILNRDTLTLINTTVSGNSTPEGGGGGIFNFGFIDLFNVTIVENNSRYGGGGISNYLSTKITMVNSIISGNQAYGSPDCYNNTGGLVSLGNNIISAASNCTFETADGDLVGNAIDPKLGPLQDNGGPTWTHALLPGSPAINGGNDSMLRSNTDQRGFSRSTVGASDIGAFEWAP